jgi:hypothetical protein
MSTALEASNRRLEMSDEIFRRHLRQFVKRWAPQDAADTFDFQADMTHLMVDAMTHRSAALAHGLETYASLQFEHLATRPLAVIYEATKEKVDR